MTLPYFTTSRFSSLYRCIYCIAFILSVSTVSAVNVSAADIVLVGETKSIELPATFFIDITIDNNEDSLSKIATTVIYPSELLALTKIKESTTVIDTWDVVSTTSNQKSGSITLSGSNKIPFSGKKGNLARLYFTSLSGGRGEVSVATSVITPSGSPEANVLGRVGKYAFTIIGTTTGAVSIGAVSNITPVLFSKTHPTSTAWYPNRTALLQWDIPAGVSSLRTTYDMSSTSTPTRLYSTPISSKEITVDQDGTYYFYLQYKNTNGWGEVAKYQLNIDSISPEQPIVALKESGIIASSTLYIQATATDNLSGIEMFEFVFDEARIEKILVQPEGIYTVYDIAEGIHTVDISAYDKAGNKSTSSRVTFTSIQPKKPLIIDYTQEVKEGVPLIIQGTTKPRQKVLISYASKNLPSTIIDTVTSDDTGKFVSRPSLPHLETNPGIYTLFAVSVDDQGNYSAYSDEKMFSVQEKAWLQSLTTILKWIIFSSAILITAVAGALALWYVYILAMRYRRRIKRTLSEAETTLKLNSTAFRRDVEEFYIALTSIKKKRDLTKEEQTILKQCKKRIKSAEEVITKKIKNIH